MMKWGDIYFLLQGTEVVFPRAGGSGGLGCAKRKPGAVVSMPPPRYHILSSPGNERQLVASP